MVRGLARWAASLAAVLLLAGAVVTFPFAVRQQVRLWVDQSGRVQVVSMPYARPGVLDLGQARDLYRAWWENGELQRAMRMTGTAWARSLRILLPALAAGLAAGGALGFAAGLYCRAREPVLGASILLFGLPDFAVTLALQWGFVLAGQALGRRLVSVGGSHAFVLPVLCLAVFPAAMAARAAAEAVERVMREPFMRTALAKGMSRRQALARHGLRHVAAHMLADMPALAGIAVSNLVMVEVLLSYPGIAHQAWTSLNHWPSNAELIPAGIALALTWFVVDASIQALRARMQPHVAEFAQHTGL